MSAGLKFLIGVAATLLVTWIAHGPLGQGRALIDGLEASARKVVSAAEVPGVEVRLGRDPLARAALLSGPANQFQRQGQGEFPGLTERVGAVDGVSTVRWADEPDAGGFVLPLLAEAMLQALIAFLIGFGIVWLLFGRKAKDGYL